MNPPRLLPYRLASHYGTFFLMMGVLLPYFPVWLAGRGLNAEEIAIIMALGSWTKLVTDPGTGWLSDRSGRPTGILVLLAVGLFVFMVLHIPAQGFWPILLVTLAAGVCARPMVALTDALTLAHDRQHPGVMDYGRVRLWGSVAFVVSNVLGGWMIDSLYPDDPDLILWMIIGSSALIVLSALSLPATKGAPPPFRFDAVGRLLKNRVFAAMIIGLGLMQGAHAVYYAFSAVHWRGEGLSTMTIGILWAEGVVAEILLFALGGALIAKLGIKRLLIFAVIGGAIRWLTLGYTTDIVALASVQLLHAATFGATHLAAMRFLSDSVPEGLGATAQGLYSAVGMGAIGGVLFVASGSLFELGPEIAYGAMAVSTVLGGVVSWLGLKWWSGTRLSV